MSRPVTASKPSRQHGSDRAGRDPISTSSRACKAKSFSKRLTRASLNPKPRRMLTQSLTPSTSVFITLLLTIALPTLQRREIDLRIELSGIGTCYGFFVCQGG
jgi:hypothetical protein